MVKVLRKHGTQISRRIAHVMFEDELVALQVLQIPNSHVIDGVQVTVEPCYSKEQLMQINQNVTTSKKNYNEDDQSTMRYSSQPFQPEYVRSNQESNIQNLAKDEIFTYQEYCGDNSSIKNMQNSGFSGFSNPSNPSNRFYDYNIHKSKEKIEQEKEQAEIQEFLEFRKFQQIKRSFQTRQGPPTPLDTHSLYSQRQGYSVSGRVPNIPVRRFPPQRPFMYPPRFAPPAHPIPPHYHQNFLQKPPPPTSVKTATNNVKDNSKVNQSEIKNQLKRLSKFKTETQNQKEKDLKLRPSKKNPDYEKELGKIKEKLLQGRSIDEIPKPVGMKLRKLKQKSDSMEKIDENKTSKELFQIRMGSLDNPPNIKENDEGNDEEKPLVEENIKKKDIT